MGKDGKVIAAFSQSWRWRERTALKSLGRGGFELRTGTSEKSFRRVADARAIRKLVRKADQSATDAVRLGVLLVPWEAVPPIWELRVGEYRVFYDVSQEETAVYIRAIRRKPRGKRTEDIL